MAPKWFKEQNLFMTNNNIYKESEIQSSNRTIWIQAAVMQAAVITCNDSTNKQLTFHSPSVSQ